MIKLCECGCGNPAPISRNTRLKRGWIKGQPKRFICGHHISRGHKIASGNGKYELTWAPNHPRTSSVGYVLSHILLAEKVIGRLLPPSIEIHHYDKKQLVICENRKYHFLLHVRTRALLACGNVHWRKCKVCKKYDRPENLKVSRTAGIYHQDCVNKVSRQKYAIGKASVRRWTRRSQEGGADAETGEVLSR